MLINYTLILALTNMTSVRAARVLLTLYAIRLEASPFAIGVLAATFGVFPMLLSWLSGRMSDRFGSRWLLMFGAAGGAGGMLLPYFAPSLLTIFIAAAMSGLALTFCNVSLQNLVGLLSKPQDRAKNFSNYSLVGAGTSFLGPLLAGFSIDHSGYAASCLYLVALPLIPIAMLVIWGGALPGGVRQATAAGSLRNTLAQPGVWRVLAVSSLSQTGTDLFQFYMPVYAHEIGLSASVIGVVLATFAVASFVVRVFLPRLIARSGEDKVLVYTFYLSAISLMLVPLSKDAAVLALIAFFFGLGAGCSTPITMMLMFSCSPGGQSGAAMGLRLSADNLTRLVGPMVFGAIASALGLPFVFWINAAMLASGGLLRGPTHDGRGGARKHLE